MKTLQEIFVETAQALNAAYDTLKQDVPGNRQMFFQVNFLGAVNVALSIEKQKAAESTPKPRRSIFGS